MLLTAKILPGSINNVNDSDFFNTFGKSGVNEHEIHTFSPMMPQLPIFCHSPNRDLNRSLYTTPLEVFLWANAALNHSNRMKQCHRIVMMPLLSIIALMV